MKRKRARRYRRPGRRKVPYGQRVWFRDGGNNETSWLSASTSGAVSSVLLLGFSDYITGNAQRGVGALIERIYMDMAIYPVGIAGATEFTWALVACSVEENSAIVLNSMDPSDSGWETTSFMGGLRTLRTGQIYITSSATSTLDMSDSNRIKFDIKPNFRIAYPQQLYLQVRFQIVAGSGYTTSNVFRSYNYGILARTGQGT